MLKIYSFIFISTAAIAAPQAILVSGGGSAESNHCDFFDDIDRANGVLTGWSKVNLVADGDQPNGPANSLQCDGTRNTLSANQLVRTQTLSPTTGQASKAEIKNQIDRINNLNPGEPVLLYFTNHGGRSVKDGSPEFSLALWKESLSNEELQKIIEEFKSKHPSNPLIFIHDHCFSGGMMNNFRDLKTGDVIPGVCGFSAASPTEYAYNGESYMRKAQNLMESRADKNNLTFAEVFDELKYKDSIKSTPTSTSDAYLENIFERDRKKLMHQTPDTISCNEKFSNDEADKLKDTSKSLSKYFNNENLKKLIKELQIKAGVSKNTSIEILESFLRTKEKEILNTEKIKNEAELLAHQVKLDWAQKKIDERYGNGVGDQILNSTGESDAIITLNNGETRHYDELHQELKNIYNTANKENLNFDQFVSEGAQNSKWPSNVMIIPEVLDNKFMEENTNSGSLRRLVQTMRRASALKHLSSKEQEQYNSLLKCENTKIKFEGT